MSVWKQNLWNVPTVSESDAPREVCNIWNKLDPPDTFLVDDAKFITLTLHNRRTAGKRPRHRIPVFFPNVEKRAYDMSRSGNDKRPLQKFMNGDDPAVVCGNFRRKPPLERRNELIVPEVEAYIRLVGRLKGQSLLIQLY